MAGLREATEALSSRIRDEGGGLTEEFETGVDAGASTVDEEQSTDDAVGAAELSTQDVETGVEADGQAGEDDGTGTAEPERFELPDKFNELGPLLGVDPGDLYGLKLTVDVGDNDSREYSLEELKDLARQPARDSVDRQRWDEERRGQEAALAQQREQAQARERHGEELARMAVQDIESQQYQIHQRYQALLQDRAREQQDPAGYAIELQRHGAAIQHLQQQRQGIDARLQQAQAERAKEFADKHDAAMKAGRARLRQMVPEWSSDETFQRDVPALTAYVKEERFGGKTDEDINSLTDPCVLFWAENSRRYEDLMRRAKAAPKPKPTAQLVPGGRQTTAMPQSKRAELEARKRLEKTGSLADAQAVLRQRFSTG